MQRISKLTLKNFKFFLGEVSIDFDRKNILLYGENGSGKSSIYWALYTFLQSVFKTDPLQIRKYFEPNHKENLINRYSLDSEGSSIIVHFEDENKASSTREISLTTINTRPGSPDNLVLNTTLGSDFIDHTILSRVYSYYHKEEIDLFDFFEQHLLSFINFRQSLTIPGQTIGNVNAEHWWGYIKLGLNPNPNISDPTYSAFQSVIHDFNTEFNFYLNEISQRTNLILKDKFQEKFKVNLQYKRATYNSFNTYNKGRNKKTIAPRIILSVELITDLITDSNKKQVRSPQSFLNEAKLSTMALAMRLAIIDEKFVAAYPKILVLDDMLISMDMSNREFVLSIILEYTRDFQLVFFTHQRGLFEDARKHIESFHSDKARKSGVTNESEIIDEWKKHWKVLEMYEGENSKHIPIPIIQPYESSLQKALKYFKENIDYNACGNNLRIALEEFFRKFIPYKYFVNNDGIPIAATSLMLDGLLVKARLYFNYIGFDTTPIDKIDRYRIRSLNPSSHYNPRTEYFKKELQDVFAIIDELKKNKNEPVIFKDQIIQFEIKTENGKSFIYSLLLLDNVSLYRKNDGSASFFKTEDERGYVIIGCTEDNIKTKILSNNIKKCTLQSLYDETLAYIALSDVPIVETDMNVVFKNHHGQSLNEIKKY